MTATTDGPALPAYATDQRLDQAVAAARAAHAAQPKATAFYCADLAVRQVFAPWILRADRSVRPDQTPGVDRLIARVERAIAG